MKISIITQPYKLCIKRETKVQAFFTRKITWLLFVSLFEKASLHSSIMAHVLLLSLIGQLDYGRTADY